MKDEVQMLINLGKCVLKNETHRSDTVGLAYVSTVSGTQCDEWKKQCKAFFDSYCGGALSEGRELANAKVLRESQAKRLLQILEGLQND